jgi:formylglycine-generating enzyme required for sulfatase activity
MALALALVLGGCATVVVPAGVRDRLGIDLVPIRGGEFLMGTDAPSGSDESPLHAVKVKDFLIGRREVTQAQWLEVMGSNPSSFAGCPDCPVETVSWDEVRVFLERASRFAGIGLRLPTEAEWEYAAGGGPRKNVWAGTDDKGVLEEYAWLAGNSEGRTHPVGSKRPNIFGLFDLSGNVWEWCADYYAADYYRRSPPSDPKGPPHGRARVVRGGSYAFPPSFLRTANRFMADRSMREAGLGFRLAADAP